MPFGNILFPNFRWTAERNGGARFLNGHLNTAILGVIKALQIEQMAAIIHDRNHHRPIVAQRFRLRARGDFPGVIQRQYYFVRSHQHITLKTSFSNIVKVCNKTALAYLI
jgi:hypothetical protein